MELFKMKNQRGSMIIIVIMLLALLSIMGISSISISNTEVEIATNDLIYTRCFFNAESGISTALKLLPSELKNEDQIDNATLGWQGNISKTDTPPFYDVSIKHKTQSGKVLFYGDTNGDYLLEYNTDGIGYPVEIIESLGTDYRGGKVIVNVGARYEEAFPMPNAALWVGNDVNANGVSGSVLGEGPPGDECPDVADILYNSPLSVIDYTGDTGDEWFEYDDSLYPYFLIDNYFNRSPLLSESEYSNETFASPERPKVFRAKGDLEIRASDGYGILLVDGNLEVKGDFLWHGLIVINGDFRFSGGGNKAIYGAVIAMGSAVRMDGGVDIYYDCTALSKLHGNLSSYKKLWWYQPFS
ncbi:MAG: hypothetical protein P8X85_04015 [Desulfobacterales bacterium]|jgi:hypothetical protein